MGERRPIAARDAALSQKIARWLALRGVSPNAISIVSVVFALGAGLAFWATSQLESAHGLLFIAGAGLVLLRLLANMFDGMVAVEFDKRSPTGELYNEIPDRVADAFILVGFGAAAGGTITLGLIATATALFVAYVRAQVAVAGAPQNFCGPMAKPHRMFTVMVAAVWAGLAPASLRPEVEILGESVGVPALALSAIVVLGLVTAARRIRLGAGSLQAMAELSEPVSRGDEGGGDPA